MEHAASKVGVAKEHLRGARGGGAGAERLRVGLDGERTELLSLLPAIVPAIGIVCATDGQLLGEVDVSRRRECKEVEYLLQPLVPFPEANSGRKSNSGKVACVGSRAEQPVCEDAKDLPPCEQQATAAGWRLHACVQQRRSLEHELEHQWQREVIECFRRGVAAIDSLGSILMHRSSLGESK